MVKKISVSLNEESEKYINAKQLSPTKILRDAVNKMIVDEKINEAIVAKIAELEKKE